MSIKNKNASTVPRVKQEQLLSEKAFIRHCLFDYHQKPKLENTNPSFLQAAKADGFLEPLLQVEEDVVDGNNPKKKVLIDYYSPHQIFIIASLSKNKVYNEQLWTHREFDWYIKQKTRFVEWGSSGYAFNIDYAKSGVKTHTELNVFDFCRDFYNFLRLLHALENSRYASFDMQRERHFNDAPSIHFDYSSLKNDPDMLKAHSLSLDKLKLLSKNIANTATQTDPLEHWYYYIHRHPQWRKDLFKGEALLAQEMYIICDLLTDVIEAVSGEKQPPMFELLYGEQNIHPYLIPRIEYVHGTDVKSMWAAIQKFKAWMNQDDNKDFVEENTLKSLESFEKELKEYEGKYSARSFISNGVREVEVEENIKIEDLDIKTKQYAEQIIQQTQTQLKESGRQFLSLWDDELEERVKKNEMTLEQAKKEDYNRFVKQEIFDAIEQRLSSLKRELWAIFDSAQKKIAKKVDEAWNIEHNFGNHFWFNRKDELNKLSREEQMKLYDAEYKKAYKEAQFWSKKRDDFGEIEYTMDLLFCSVCREKPVAIHQSHNDQKISNNAICDDCIRTAKDPKTIKQAELKCDYCGNMLYKYAYQNRLNDLLFNKAPADIDVELEYGRLQIRIKCKSCKQVNSRWVDWGWTA